MGKVGPFHKKKNYTHDLKVHGQIECRKILTKIIKSNKNRKNAHTTSKVCEQIDYIAGKH